MTTPFEDIKKYYNSCRPNEPIGPNDHRWVDLAPLRGSGQDIVSQMLRQIEMESAFANILVTGFRGTGKTSLLMACREKLAEAGYHVIYTDAEADYLVNPHEEININDVLLVIAMAIVDDGFGPSHIGRLWDDIKSLASVQVIPEGVDVQVGVATFKATLERLPVLHERLRTYARQRSLYEQVEQLTVSAQAEVKRKKQRGLVLIVDNLDHLSDPPEKTGTPVTDSVLRVLRDAPELRRLNAHLILTVPPTILPYARALWGDYGEPFIVPEARVITRKDERDSDGFSIMEEFIDKRVPLSCFDTIESARSLIAASGGYLRDLLRLLQNCLASIDAPPITCRVVERAIRRGISLSEDLPLEDYRTDIQEILNNPRHRLPRDEARLPRLYQMIRDRVILRYLNDDSWEGIHPFVMALVDKERFERLVFPYPCPP